MSLKGRRRVRTKRFTSSQASRLASRLIALENALFYHFSSNSNPKIVSLLAHARQLSLRRANSRSSETILAQARIIQYNPVFHSPMVSHTTTNASVLTGRKVVVVGCDFRQILSMRGYHSNIVHATINSSYIWHQCRILNLTKNMCLQNNDNATEIKEISEWILKVGGEKLSESNDGCVEVDITEELLITQLMTLTYPNLQLQYKDEQFLLGQYFHQQLRFIILGEENEYLSSDSVDMSDANYIEAVNN
ncbi:hypothetical protein Lal_00037595 [Lupinus albus]|nr:hypothetical protein Lal_00037595 [Lupinus albus]